MSLAISHKGYLSNIRLSLIRLKFPCEAMTMNHRHVGIKPAQIPFAQNSAEAIKEINRRVWQVHHKMGDGLARN